MKKKNKGRAASKGMFDASLAETTSYENLWDYTWALQDACGDLIQRTEDGTVEDPVGELNDLLDEFCQAVRSAIVPAIQLNDNSGADEGDSDEEDAGEGDELDEDFDQNAEGDDDESDEDDSDDESDEDEDEDDDDEKEAAVKAARHFLSRKASEFFAKLKAKTKADGDDEDEENEDDADSSDDETDSDSDADSDEDDDPEKAVVKAAMAFHKACKNLDEQNMAAASGETYSDDDLDSAENDEENQDDEDEDSDEDEDEDEDETKSSRKSKATRRQPSTSKNKRQAQREREVEPRARAKAKGNKEQADKFRKRKAVPATDAVTKSIELRLRKLEQELAATREENTELEEIAREALATAEQYGRQPEPRARQQRY